jgi:hypothetical protein
MLGRGFISWLFLMPYSRTSWKRYSRKFAPDFLEWHHAQRWKGPTCQLRAGRRRSGTMPLYMDRHKNLEGLTAEAVAEDHKKDLEVQDKHGAKALKYWFNEEKGEVYCLFEAPNAEAAEAVHREAHGNVADEIIEVKEGS